MNTKKIAIIGGGNLGTAIAEGLLKSGFAKPAQITITRRTLSRLSEQAYCDQRGNGNFPNRLVKYF